jgi:hypothetical protein
MGKACPEAPALMTWATAASLGKESRFWIERLKFLHIDNDSSGSHA